MSLDPTGKGRKRWTTWKGLDIEGEGRSKGRRENEG